MKKIYNKIFYISLFIFILASIFLFTANAFAFDEIDISFPSTNGSEGITEVNKIANNIWGTALKLIQYISFAAIIFAGVRYMFASAEKKADIKQGLIYIVIGAILVFSASTVVRFVTTVVEKDLSSVKTQKIEIAENKCLLSNYNSFFVKF